jgi:DNA-binding HxlR family transcriptional regulator
MPMPLKRRKSRVLPPPQACPLLECMSFLGSAWAPSVVWFLSAGPRRFSELRSDIPKVSAKVLSARLRALEGQGVIQRKVMPTSPPTVEYSLTELGREFMPAITAIAEVGFKLKMRRAGSVAPVSKSRKAA